MGKGKLFASLLNAAKSSAGPALTSGALTGGLSLLTGSSPLAALGYGLADTLASGASVAGVRALRPGSYSSKKVRNLDTGKIETINKTSRAEMPVNIIASIGTGALASNVLEPSQSLQISQQVEQRSLMNRLPLYDQEMMLSPGTQYQMAGLPTQESFQQLLNDQLSSAMSPNTSWMDYLNPQDRQLIQQALG